MNNRELPIITMNNIMKFWDKVHKTDTCWLWTGSKTKYGYGRQMIAGEVYLATRVSYYLHKGIDPGNLNILHEEDCNNPSCVRPDHLYLGTQKDNMRQCALQGRISTSSRCKLDIELVRKIRKLSDTMTNLQISRLIGVARPTVYNVVNRVTWQMI